jgi:putative flippase GtrA
MKIADFIDNLVNFFAEKILRRKLPKGFLQFFRYLICGGTSTLVDMTVLYCLTHFAHTNHLVATPIAYVTGTVTNYTLNTLLVFKSSGNIKKEFPTFAAIGIIGLLWTEIFMWLFVNVLGTYIMVAKIIAVIFVLNWNFFMRKKFVFSSKTAAEKQEII